MRHEWQQTGVLASTIANAVMMAVGSFGRRRLSANELTKPTDFIPYSKPDKPRQTPQQIARLLMQHGRSNRSRTKR